MQRYFRFYSRLDIAHIGYRFNEYNIVPSGFTRFIGTVSIVNTKSRVHDYNSNNNNMRRV